MKKIQHQNCDFSILRKACSIELVLWWCLSSQYVFREIRDRSQTLVRGEGDLMQKIFISKIFRGPPSDRQKKSGPPFLP